MRYTSYWMCLDPEIHNPWWTQTFVSSGITDGERKLPAALTRTQPSWPLPSTFPCCVACSMERSHSSSAQWELPGNFSNFMEVTMNSVFRKKYQRSSPIHRATLKTSAWIFGCPQPRLGQVCHLFLAPFNLNWTHKETIKGLRHLLYKQVPRKEQINSKWEQIRTPHTESLGFENFTRGPQV